MSKDWFCKKPTISPCKNDISSTENFIITMGTLSVV